MKKVLVSICLLVGSFSFAQSKEHKPELKLELRSNAKDEVISRIDNDKKDQTIDLKREHHQDRLNHKLERKHERPHFDKNKDKKEVEKTREHIKEKAHERREKRQEIIKERRNG